MNSKKFDHVTPLLHQLNWLPVKQLLLYKDTVTTYKCRNDLAPQYQSDKFIECSRIHAHYTHKGTHFRYQFVKLPQAKVLLPIEQLAYGTVWTMTLRIVPP